MKNNERNMSGDGDIVLKEMNSKKVGENGETTTGISKRKDNSIRKVSFNTESLLRTVDDKKFTENGESVLKRTVSGKSLDTLDLALYGADSDSEQHQGGRRW